MRAIRWLIGGVLLVVFAAFVGIVWLAYQQEHRLEGEPPLIKASAEPYRRAPSERGGLAVLNEESALVQALEEPTRPTVVERILPPPPPAPKAATEIVATTPPPETLPTVTAAASVQSPPDDPLAAAVAPLETAPVTATDAPVELPDALASPDVVAEPNLPRLPERDRTAEAPATAEIARTTDLPVITAPTRRTTADPLTEQATIATISPSILNDASTSPGRYRLQLGAFRTQEQADQAASQILDDFTPGVELRVIRAETENGVYFRVQTRDGTTREAANRLCDALKQAGGDCFVTADAS